MRYEEHKTFGDYSITREFEGEAAEIAMLINMLDSKESDVPQKVKARKFNSEQEFKEAIDQTVQKIQEKEGFREG